MDLNKLLAFAVEHGASDVHIQAACVPMLRVSGQIRAVEGPELTDDEALRFITAIAPEAARPRIKEAIYAGLDFSYEIPGVSRFRCSAFLQKGLVGMTVRVVRTVIPTLESLHLPEAIRDIALSERGLTLLTGTTGSGKSTTLAVMVDLINQTHRLKIITIEDPIEYVHVSKKALISQLEVGSDTPSFEQALRQALRQDPDVILVGELRDVETLRMALRAADTGHQVFSTVHSATAPQTIERIIAMFPTAEHKLLLQQLAGSVEAIISQRLVNPADGGRRPAVEILRGTAVSEKFILENRLAELPAYMETGDGGMQTFDQHLAKLHHDGIIRTSEALRHASNPEGLAMRLRGIQGIGAGRKA